MKSMNRMKKAVLALAGAAVMVTGTLSQPAQAFNFQQGDLILAIYGNRTPGEGAEALINLTDLTGANSGPSMNVLNANPGTTYTFDLSAYLNAAGVKDLNPAAPAYPVRYTVFSFQPGSVGFDVMGGTAASNVAGTFQPVLNTLTAAVSWAGNVNDTNAPNQVTGQNGAVLGFTNTNSITSRMGLAEKLAGGWNPVMAANLDQLLNIFMVDSETEGPATAEGQALLSANGLFQITGGQLAPVPVPAAVVLFGSGLIGLAGMARRNLFRQAA